MLPFFSFFASLSHGGGWRPSAVAHRHSFWYSALVPSFWGARFLPSFLTSRTPPNNNPPHLSCRLNDHNVITL